MVLVKLLRTRYLNGKRVMKGDEVDVGEMLAKRLVRRAIAEYVDGEPVPTIKTYVELKASDDDHEDPPVDADSPSDEEE